MSRAQVAGAAVGVLGGTGGLAAALGRSPVAVYVLGGLYLVALLIVGTVLLVPVLSRDDRRADRALTVLRLLLATDSGRPRRSRPAPATAPRRGPVASKPTPPANASADSA